MGISGIQVDGVKRESNAPKRRGCANPAERTSKRGNWARFALRRGIPNGNPTRLRIPELVAGAQSHDKGLDKEVEFALVFSEVAAGDCHHGLRIQSVLERISGGMLTSNPRGDQGVL